LQSINVHKRSLFFVNDNYGTEFSLTLSEKPNLLLSRSLMLVTRAAWTKRAEQRRAQKHRVARTFFGIFSAGGWEPIVFTTVRRRVVGTIHKMWLFGETVIDIFKTVCNGCSAGGWSWRAGTVRQTSWFQIWAYVG
jgi:hypothetical protein